MKTRIRKLTEQEKRSVGEQQMIADWLKIFPKGILSIVSDTFDLWKLITVYLPNLKEQIINRNGKLVIRPDSGNPVDIICGTLSDYQDISKYFPEGEVLPEYFEEYLLEEVRENTPHGKQGDIEYENIYIIRGELYKAKINNISWNRHDKQYYFLDMWEEAKITIEKLSITPSDKGVVELLWDIFGGTVNKQGYKVLNSHIGAIYGDSITPERQLEIYKRLEAKGFAATNIVLGIGSFTYQYNTRDTCGWAAKGAWFEIKENNFDNCDCTMSGYGECRCQRTIYSIYKDPITDNGTKKSLKGLLQVTEEFTSDSLGKLHHNKYVVKEECTPEEENEGLLQVIYENGNFHNQTTLTQIREKLAKI